MCLRHNRQHRASKVNTRTSLLQVTYPSNRQKPAYQLDSQLPSTCCGDFSIHASGSDSEAGSFTVDAQASRPQVQPIHGSGTPITGDATERDTYEATGGAVPMSHSLNTAQELECATAAPLPCFNGDLNAVRIHYCTARHSDAYASTVASLCGSNVPSGSSHAAQHDKGEPNHNSTSCVHVHHSVPRLPAASTDSYDTADNATTYVDSSAWNTWVQKLEHSSFYDGSDDSKKIKNICKQLDGFVPGTLFANKFELLGPSERQVGGVNLSLYECCLICCPGSAFLHLLLYPQV